MTHMFVWHRDQLYSSEATQNASSSFSSSSSSNSSALFSSPSIRLSEAELWEKITTYVRSLARPPDPSVAEGEEEVEEEDKAVKEEEVNQRRLCPSFDFLVNIEKKSCYCLMGSLKLTWRIARDYCISIGKFTTKGVYRRLEKSHKIWTMMMNAAKNVKKLTKWFRTSHSIRQWNAIFIFAITFL